MEKLGNNGSNEAVKVDTGALDLEAAVHVVEIASKELGRLCEARWKGGEAWEKVWHWEIPASEERDTDLRLGAAIGLANDLIKEVRHLRKDVAHLLSLGGMDPQGMEREARLRSLLPESSPAKGGN